MAGWRAAALCSTFPTLPWIQDPERQSATAQASMRLVCDLCPVRTQCGAYVTGRGITSGFWAGESRDEPLPDARQDGAA